MLFDLDSNESLDEYCITTIDNPWNPFTQFKEWYAFDNRMGYRSLERWARMRRTLAMQARTDDEDTVAEEAIDELVRLDPLQMYTKVKRETNCKQLNPELRKISMNS